LREEVATMPMPISEHLPDLLAFQGGAGEALKVFAASRSYRPFSTPR
jgi:hypothetical protein